MWQEPPSFSHPQQADTSENAGTRSSEELGNVQYWVVDDKRPQPEETLDWIQLPMHKITPSTSDSPIDPTNMLVLHVPTLKKHIQDYELKYWLEQILNMPPEEDASDDVSIVPETPPLLGGEFEMPETSPPVAGPETNNDVLSQGSFKTALEDDGFDIVSRDTEPTRISEESLEQSQGPLSPSSEATGSLSPDLGAPVDDKRKTKTEKNGKSQKAWPYGCYGCGQRFGKSSTFMKHLRKYPRHRKPNVPILADKPTTPASELPPIDPAAELRRILGYDPLSALSAEPLPSAL